MISIDMPAGPSEVLVIADRHANPVHVASDLLSQVLTFLFFLVFELPRCLLALKWFCSFLMEQFHNERLMLLLHFVCVFFLSLKII
jgi:hypothetical protein